MSVLPWKLEQEKKQLIHIDYVSACHSTYSEYTPYRHHRYTTDSYCTSLLVTSLRTPRVLLITSPRSARRPRFCFNSNKVRYRVYGLRVSEYAPYAPVVRAFRFLPKKPQPNHFLLGEIIMTMMHDLIATRYYSENEENVYFLQLLLVWQN